jgi:hypothetical protein
MSHRLEVLNARVPAQRSRWLEILSTWPDREPFAHPDYVDLFTGSDEQPLCLALADGDSRVVLPLVLRPLASLHWSPESLAWDASSPYGYGGPFCWGSLSQATAEGFWRALATWAREANVVTSFLRLSLFPDQLLPDLDGTTAEAGTNIIRPLGCSDSELWESYDRKVRKNVNRANRENLRFELDVDGANLDDFIRIYQTTMDRNNAASTYYFSRDFFVRLLRDLADHVLLFHIFDGATVVSTEIVLQSRLHLYSFLGGTTTEAYPKRPNDLLKHEISRWGLHNNKRSFVLGGGYGGKQDGIFKYKLTLSPEGSVPFRVARIVHNQAALGELCETRRKWENESHKDWDPQPHYFPPYRS